MASETLAIALQHHQAGRLQAAEQIYRRILAVEPNQADAWHLLGIIAYQVGKHELAVEYIGRAIGSDGTDGRVPQQPGQCLAGPGKAGRGGRLLPPGTGTEAGLRRGTQQPGQRA